ncbi:Tat (twin-arginine translocation) pathway signal sequence containing protein [Catalinimonas niigatensis]|uniref:Tat (twin-arginine translocation) pathway signal sequence containing protein n=1 Tax=Catalinimonas niigatensis TaxID=1397264 RepID=UPI0026658BA6|nr:Tat (twin-arginine translocation) pathway signal sequence containing protein [Catalinimonas niigatensis]WPP50745.1 Tat (twin-arginine translocation) pathway signal sequence containing protein [Catalinimonas niigatensis]
METTLHSRRKFMGTLAATASMSGLTVPLLANTDPKTESKHVSEADAWFKKVKGSHRVVYDAPEPHMGFPFIWSWAFYLTNNQTGTADDDMTAVVVLRHNAIPFAMEDKLWQKYKFGDTFHVNDNTTGASALRNPFYVPKEGDYPMPGIDGIKTLQDRGVMICVCDLAMTVYSSGTAQSMNLKPEEVKKEWEEGVLPGIQIVPSGVWALGRAQEHGCGYIYAGG